MEDKDFADKIKAIEAELLALKTAQTLAPNVKAFYYNFTVDMTSGYSTITAGNVVCYRVNYKSGENAIISDWYGDGSFWATTPVNDSQLVYIFAQHILSAGVVMLSTREVATIEKVNLS